MNLKVMTWNIWSGKNWKQIINFVKKNGIDVMGFQEVDNNLERTGYVNITEKIAQALGYYYVYSPSIENQKTGKVAGGEFGNCIISRFPIVESKRYFLIPPEDWDGTAITEPRTLLETKISMGSKIICFMTSHLGYSREFNTSKIKLKQIEKIVEVIQKNKDLPTILVGDFNSLPGSQEIGEIKQFLRDVDETNSIKTWTMYAFEYHGWEVPAGLNFKIDYIFVSKKIKCKTPIIDNTKISDHIPVIVKLELEADNVT